MSWYQLLSTIRESADYQAYYDSQPPVACPNDGTPLQTGPEEDTPILWCPFDGWTYPRDYDPATMSGM